MTPRANRIPRVYPTRPSVSARICRWWQLLNLRSRRNNLIACLNSLQDELSGLKAEKFIASRALLKTPTLDARIASTGAEVQRVADEIDLVEIDIKALEAA